MFFLTIVLLFYIENIIEKQIYLINNVIKNIKIYFIYFSYQKK